MSVQTSPVIAQIARIITPIASDLGLEVYDLEHRGSVLRVTLDTPPGSSGGVNLDALALATRLLSRELDHEDPLPGRYTLEVTSPGVERTLRTPAHFQREVGKTISVRLRDVGAAERRIEGLLIAADETTATVQVTDPDTLEPVARQVDLSQIERARTVFIWGPSPKPGHAPAGKSAARKSSAKKASAKNPAASKSGAGSSAGTPKIEEPKESS